MVDTTIACGSTVFRYRNQDFKLKAGIHDNIPYAETDPRNSTIEAEVSENIKFQQMPTFCPKQVQQELDGK